MLSDTSSVDGKELHRQSYGLFCESVQSELPGLGADPRRAIHFGHALTRGRHLSYVQTRGIHIEVYACKSDSTDSCPVRSSSPSQV